MLSAGLLAAATAALEQILGFSGPADRALSRYFRGHRELGQRERAFVAESAFAVLRRKRSLEAMAGAATPAALLAAALLRVFGYSGRSLHGLVEELLIERIRRARTDDLPAARAL